MKRYFIKNVVVVLVFLLITVFVCSCSGNNNSNTGKSGSGLSLEIDSIPEVIYDSEPISIEVLLKNLGSYDIPSGATMLKLSGYDPSLFDFPNEGVVRLAKLNGNNEQSTGFSDYVDLGSSRLKDNFLGENLPDVSPTFILNACYLYQTTASVQVCINPDIYSSSPKVGECHAGSAKVYNTNAPIAVSSVQERFLSYDRGTGILKVKFDVTISNVGKGKIWSPNHENYMYECGKYYSNIKEIQNKVEIKSATLSGAVIDCTTASGSNVITLAGNSATFSCLGEIRADDAYTTQLDINIEYGNSMYISKKVTIKSSKYIN
jgi:hypothetical protein